MLAPNHPANATVATSINKRLCQHTVDESTIQSSESTRAGLERRHLAFAVANCVLNQRFAAATVGSCGDSWKLQRQMEAATGCRQGPQYEGKCSFYFNYYFFCTTPTNRDLRQKAVCFPARLLCIIVQKLQIKNFFLNQNSPLKPQPTGSLLLVWFLEVVYELPNLQQTTVVLHLGWSPNAQKWIQ